MNDKTVRDSNFELLRIILILMIIGNHYFFNGGSISILQPSNFNFYIDYSLLSFFIVAVNCFILITGFFQINKEFNFKKVVELWTEVFFYSFSISAIFWILKLEPINVKNIINTFFPVITAQWWFISLYIVLYCFSPFINIAINHMDQNTHKKLLLLIAFFYVLLPSIRPNFTYFQDNGYSIQNFIFLYCLGAYIRKYDIPYKINYLNAYILTSLFLFLGFVSGTALHKNCGNFFDYSFIPVELSSFFLFMCFKNIKLNSSLINKIAASVFGIYLITQHQFIRTFMYYKILHCSDYYYSPFFFPHMLVSLVGIFIFCLLIETFRQQLFKAYQLQAFKVLIQELPRTFQLQAFKVQNNIKEVRYAADQVQELKGASQLHDLLRVAMSKRSEKSHRPKGEK
jgi:surface polysaccharide O-acyltransferase-like enzyme